MINTTQSTVNAEAETIAAMFGDGETFAGLCRCHAGAPADDDFRPIDGPSVATVHRQWLDRGMPAETWAGYVANRQAEQDRNATTPVTEAVTAR